VQLKHRTPNSEVHLITRVYGMGTPLYYSHTLLISFCASSFWGGRERAVSSIKKAPPPETAYIWGVILASTNCSTDRNFSRKLPY